MTRKAFKKAMIEIIAKELRRQASGENPSGIGFHYVEDVLPGFRAVAIDGNVDIPAIAEAILVTLYEVKSSPKSWR